MNLKLVVIFVISLLDEFIIAAFLLWGLPSLGVRIPLPWLIVIFLVLAAYGVISYRIIARSLARKGLVGLADMVGCRGKVVVPLAPEGTVKIMGELWRAECAEGRIETGAEVVVLAKEGLKLVVRKNDDGGH